MLKTRIIPILTFNGFGLVKTRKFSTPRMVGNPVQAARVYNSRGVDELVFLDIFASKQNRKINLKLVGDVIRECYMPVAIGGGISAIGDINDLLKAGADKVVIKGKIFSDPEFINEASRIFGDQCITLAVDATKIQEGYFVYHDNKPFMALEEFFTLLRSLNFGEVILTSVDNDGMMDGFDTELVKLAEQSLKVPIVAAGGGGRPEHFSSLLRETSIEAVAAASIFHFTQYTPSDIKEEIARIGRPVRMVAKKLSA
jgi:imidazole glycerol-phosphate synthase subunit HisF